MSGKQHFIPSRESALERLELFVSEAGRQYEKKRNYDFSSEDRSNVSVLSPYVRRRLISEQEIVRAVLAEHSYKTAEKFIQEVCWRTYWKGWLELRPDVWTQYRQELQALQKTLNNDELLRKRLHDAHMGRTGIVCFDDWVRELNDTGYVHNHARMWFASIWIFTLELPWQLGADFFYRHLLDGDPASNTLSWRWVAGIQTKGKHYIATASNIKKFTAGRYDPKGQLNESPEPLREDTEFPRRTLTVLETPDQTLRTLLLLHGDDLSCEHIPYLERLNIVDAASISLDNSYGFTDDVEHFNNSAREDAESRVSESFEIPVAKIRSTSDLETLLDSSDIHQIVCAQPTQGPDFEALEMIRPIAAERSTPVLTLRRTWDEKLFPHATHGFFRFRKQLPKIITKLCG